ncbi:peptidase S28 [Desarmillaria tabescens]|uniref:Peptidase S28 n=1 Tax=Armillaria tabescens TaxID=1929756 RepID=A0AA39JED0_ARMTA|nr:peptidase S28 [Desarmillaria tabescens]KAK0441216.1 peptidase S28 [Desarmillaria tabescens]
MRTYVHAGPAPLYRTFIPNLGHLFSDTTSYMGHCKSLGDYRADCPVEQNFRRLVLRATEAVVERLADWRFDAPSFSLCVVITLGSHALGRTFDRRAIPKAPGIPKVDMGGHKSFNALFRESASVTPYDTVYYFDQLIDHDDPSKGMFKQRYWHSAEFYKEGGPIILMNAGEVDASNYYSYVTDSTINGVVAQKFGGAAIVLEHRFLGQSNPYPNLNVDSLKYMTVAQTIEDHLYFAQNVVLPQDNGDSVGPDKAPWILIGGSYPGGLASRRILDRLCVIGSCASTAVRLALSSIILELTYIHSDFWQYFEPIRENMPKNCSADVEAVITYIDEVFFGTDTEAQMKIRNLFGFNSTNLALAEALRWDLWSWQELQPSTGPWSSFYRFCDALEVKNGVSAPEGGWGVENALSAWAQWLTPTNGTVNATDASRQPPTPAINPKELEARADHPVGNTYRSWLWLKDGPPIGQGGIVSRLNTVESDLRLCVVEFPDAFPTIPHPDGDRINALYGGWGVKNKRLFFANGKQATVSAVNSTAVSTEDQPIGLSNGFHCTDLVMALAAPDPTVVAVQDLFLEYVEKWLKDFVAN